MVATDSLNVLEASPPRFPAEEVAAIAADLFDLHGEARDLGSERDQTFLIEDGGEGGVLKISNAGEDSAVLDLEASALLHIARVDPELPIARQRGSGTYRGHFVRLFGRMPGRNPGPDLPDDAVFAFAATHARLTLALRGFFHLAALRSARRLRKLLRADQRFENTEVNVMAVHSACGKHTTVGLVGVALSLLAMLAVQPIQTFESE